MRCIINYLRQCFCKHDFKYEEALVERVYGPELGHWERVSRTCTKCGWHTTYWKF